jgi:aspartokinase/homoserine dehydrogenase 1
VCGLANSRQYVISDEGVGLDDWQATLQHGTAGTIEDFARAIIRRNLPNTVFTDITASQMVSEVYPSLLEKSIAVVACNKIACSSPYAYYQQLKELSAEYHAPFLFETNVGAGLPVIGTLNDLLRSGDQVHRIQAVLSGTLNFVFNNYDGTRSFSSVVRQAMEEGYTEPDPRLDLSGKDVMRKIMILAREAGHPVEMEDIANESFMPAECMTGTVEEFFACMEKYEDHFRGLLYSAREKNCILKFVASMEDGRASVGLQHISAAHDFYHLYGKDNIVLFHTDRYPVQPLVVKGAGAGADVTASGIFADIMRTLHTD